MSEEVDENKKEENGNENKDEEPKKKKKKKKKAVKPENQQEKEQEAPEGGYNKDITRKNYEEDDNDNIKQLNQEALSNIPSKEIPKKKKKKKKKEDEEQNKEENQIKEESEEKNENQDKRENKEIDINDILNNNNNNANGELMITELLNVEGDKKKKKKHKKKENKENNNNENIKVEINEKAKEENNIYLKDKYKTLGVPDTLKEGINKGISKSNEEIAEDIKSHKIIISDKSLKAEDLLNINKSFENILSGNKKVFLTDVNKYITKENIKNLKFLKDEEQVLRKNIEKLNQNQKMIEDSMPLQSNIIENNIRKSQLKSICRTKEELMQRLESINQKVENLLNDEKLRQKNGNKHNLTDIILDDEDKYNLRLAEMQKNEKNIRKKYELDLKKAIKKKNIEYDKKEKSIKELRKKLFNEARDKEKENFLKRKNEIKEKMEKTKKFINEKVQKSEKDYLFYRYQDNFDKKEKKLFDKINMTKKPPMVTQKELKELTEKIQQQKQYLQDSLEDKKKQMQKLWNYRSQTLPTYRHPLMEKIEEEKIKKMNEEEEEKKKKECNQLERINYKPPSVKVNKRLKIIREKRINPNSKEMVMETELNNKKRLNKFRFTPIKSNKNPIIKDEKIIELNNNNYINLNEVKKSLSKKTKNKLKPIQILHPRPEKAIDYLKDLKEKRNMSTELKNKKGAINFDDLFRGDTKNENIIESLEVAKIRTELIDRRVERKKEIINSNGGYLKNPYLAGEIGDLLVESIQAKLKLMNKLGGDD